MKLRLFYFLTVMILWSCDSERVFEKYQGMETQYWHINDTVSFYFESPLEASASLIAVKYNQDYEFRNLYLRYFLMDSVVIFAQFQG